MHSCRADNKETRGSCGTKQLAPGRTYILTHFMLAPFLSPLRNVLVTASSSSLVPDFLSGQSDLSRLTNTLRAVMEVNERCWRGDECELSNGVRLGLEQVAEHSQQHSEISEVRVCKCMFSGLGKLTEYHRHERCMTPLLKRSR